MKRRTSTRSKFPNVNLLYCYENSPWKQLVYSPCLYPWNTLGLNILLICFCRLVELGFSTNLIPLGRASCGQHSKVSQLLMSTTVTEWDVTKVSYNSYRASYWWALQRFPVCSWFFTSCNRILCCSCSWRIVMERVYVKTALKLFFSWEIENDCSSKICLSRLLPL